MGFAGQVFAARVAVGLAMPSPKAFSQAGQMIGGFASRMYGNLRRQNVQAAKKSLETSQQNLATARAGLEKHSRSQDKFLENSARGAVQRLKSAYKGLGASATASAGAMKALKRAAPKNVRTKLFANIGKDMADGKKFEQMLMNFTKLRKDERKEIINGIQIQKNALANQVNTSAKKEKLGDEAVQIIRDEIAVLEAQEKEYKHFDSVRTTGDEKYGQTKKRLGAQVVQADKEVTKAQRELNDVQKDVAQTQAFIQNGIEGIAVEMKTNFVDAVRESISVLTAFYYKLQENTQELIQFERELLNANSVFRVTNDELFAVGDQVVQFGQQFGLEMQNGATGLYQLASAGLSAADSMEVLNETLKLSMAVQGDHNTISKLVTQTLFGFEMEMSEAALVTDKFAFAIQKSLIEYQDLASAVKFALPFFTSTGQSIDQLLGALQILTNRALEAGIAGRGLRQGVAELAESIGDATANFKQMGVEVVDAEGNMLQLTEIAANFSQVLSKGVINDTELLTTLIQDLNVRGATAFVHLVQSSDEFTEAVEATASAGGELDEMIKIQNESIQAQIQILRNNISMMFLYNDAAFEGTGYLNAFHQAIVETVEDFQNLLVVQTDSGYVLTEFGKNIQEVAIRGIHEMRVILQQLVPFVKSFVENMSLSIKILEVYLLPLKIIIGAMELLGSNVIKAALAFHLMNKILPIGTALGYAYQLMQLKGVVVDNLMIKNATKNTLMTQSYTAALITKFFWENLMNSLYITKTATMGAYTAAESYSALVQAFGITLDEKEAAAMTRKEALRLLATKGIVLEAAALKGKEAPQVAELALEQTGIFTKTRLWLLRQKNALAMWYENFSMKASLKTMLLAIPLQIKNIALKITEVMWTKFGTLVQLQRNLVDKIMLYNKGLGIIAAIGLGIALVIETVAMIAASVAAWALAIPLGIIAAITSPITLSIGALVVGLIALAAVFYKVGQRVEEQFGLMFKLKELFMNFFGMIKWGAGMVLGFFTGMGDKIYEVMEGPLLKFSLFVTHTFKMIIYYVKLMGAWINEKLVVPMMEGLSFIASGIVKYMIEPLVNGFVKVKEFIEGLRNPLFDMFQGAKSLVKEGLVDPIMFTVNAVKEVLGLAAGAGKAVGKAIVAVVPKANGGYVTPMAAGGMASSGKAPYLVGERGPEIFMPSSSGKIIPNKDLNTQRVDKMLQRAFSDKGGAGGKPMVVQNLTVENLDVESLSANKTAMAIDSFAGKASSHMKKVTGRRKFW